MPISACPLCGAGRACPLRPVQWLPNQGDVVPRGTDGILNVDKPAGMTSHDVVAAVRKMSGQSRVGHAGTLDPMATGVLLLCLGQGTRVVEFLSDHDKKYRARVRLGITTDTYDATGRVTAERPVSASREQIQTALAFFTGKITQVPPAYSAIKQNGVPLYKLARRGAQVEVEPRQVEIYSITLNDTLNEFTPPDFEIEVHCSKGTYIRSLAHDLGEKLGCGAHLAALRRTAVGPFTLEEAVALETLREAFLNGYAERYQSPLDEALLQFEALVVDPDVAKRIRQGNPITCGRAYSSPLLRAYSTTGELVALLERSDAADVWKPKKVFA